ncbi:MAG TPA: sensor histidine kinase [Candidatus Nanopelagicales bacterium]|nr:sensor histidine kinase [Candidatus Nanopelagicales bacterium]
MTDRPAPSAAAGPARPGPATARPGGIDVWERWLPAWHVFNYAVLGLTSAIAFSEGEPDGPARAVVVAVVAVLAVAYWVAWIHRSIWDQAPWVRFAYAVLLLSGFAILLLLSPPFVFLQFSLYAQVFFCLPQRWAIVGGLSIGGILAVDTLVDAGGDLEAAAAEMVLEVASAAAFTMLSAWIGAIIEQSAERQALLEQLAATRAELAAAEREAGTLEERARLAREIHDTLAQGFASVVTHLEAADAVLDGNPPRAREHMRAAEGVARASLGEARGLVWALRPTSLADGGLPAALERAGSAAAAGAGPAIEVTVSGRPRPLHPDVEVTILRAAQEALANVERHAAAGRTTLTLTYFDDEVSLDVIDDGRGFDPGSLAAPGLSGGHGLRGMRERAERLGGRLEIESAPGEGTAIALALPAPAPLGVPP